MRRSSNNEIDQKNLPVKANNNNKKVMRFNNNGSGRRKFPLRFIWVLFCFV